MPADASFLQRAHSAILSVYEREDLRRELKLGLGRDFDTLVAPAAFDRQVFELLQRAERSGNLQLLLTCLADARPHSDELLALCAELQVAYGSNAPAPDPNWGLAAMHMQALQNLFRVPFLRSNESFVGREQDLHDLPGGFSEASPYRPSSQPLQEEKRGAVVGSNMV